MFFCSGRAEAADGPVRTLRIASNAAPGYGGISGLAYLRETVADLLEGRQPQVTGEDGLRALEVVEAVYESAASGQRVTVAS